MKRQYKKPKLEIKSYIRHDVIMVSVGDGYADDPFIQD